MQEGFDKMVGVKGIDIMSCLYIVYISIGSEDGIMVSYFIEDVCDVFGVDWFYVFDIVSV